LLSDILVDLATCAVRIADFGLSTCSLTYHSPSHSPFDDNIGNGTTSGNKAKEEGEGEDKGDQTMYVVTRWYRAPEVLLGSKDYGAAIGQFSHFYAHSASLTCPFFLFFFFCLIPEDLLYHFFYI
jgi:serine/threonine protein kinase